MTINGSYVGQVSTVLRVRYIVSVIPIVGLFLCQIPRVRHMITIFRVERVLMATFSPSHLTMEVGVIRIAPCHPTVLVFPDAVSLFALIVLVGGIALRVFRHVASMFRVRATRRLVPLVIRFVVRASYSLRVNFVRVMVIAAVVVTFARDDPTYRTFFLVVRVAITHAPTVATFGINVRHHVKRYMRPPYLRQVIRVITFAQSIKVKNHYHI